MNNYPGQSQRVLIDLLVQANQFRIQSEYQKALDFYKEITRLYGEIVDICRQLGFCYFQLGLNYDYEDDFQQAIFWLKRAIDLEPTKSELHSTLGQFYSLGTLEYDLAIQEYHIALELNPNNVYALSEGASLYGVPEDVISLDEAIQWLERAIELEPNDSNFHFRLATLYHEADRIEDAKTQWLAALLCPRPLDNSSAQFIRELEVWNNLPQR